jgi:hypothetical protein
MNQTLMYLQADMHRAINDGNRTLEISVLDLKELLSTVMSFEGRQLSERVGRVGQGCGFIRPDKLKDLRSGKRMYCTVRLRKNEEFSEQIYCLPEPKPPIDAIAETAENGHLQTCE